MGQSAGRAMARRRIGTVRALRRMADMARGVRAKSVVQSNPKAATGIGRCWWRYQIFETSSRRFYEETLDVCVQWMPAEE